MPAAGARLDDLVLELLLRLHHLGLHLLDLLHHRVQVQAAGATARVRRAGHPLGLLCVRGLELLGVELGLQPLDQLLLAELRLGAVRRDLLLALEQHVDRAQALADDRLHRVGQALARLLGLGLSLVEGGAGRKADLEHRLLDVHGDRARGREHASRAAPSPDSRTWSSTAGHRPRDPLEVHLLGSVHGRLRLDHRGSAARGCPRARLRRRSGRDVASPC